MGKYIKKKPEQVTFQQKGLNGYSFDLQNGVFEMSYIDSYQGHEKYCTLKTGAIVYYILEGNGVFKISEEEFLVKAGDVVEIPAGTEFVYAGKMKLILVMTPIFNPDNEIVGKENDLYKE